ncbi:MAG: hypothetical protein WBB82_03670 [Limnothrix sp.]
MATNKPSLSDLLREEVQQEDADGAELSEKEKTEIPGQPSKSTLARMTKAQLLEHIETLYERPLAPVVTMPDTSDIAAKNEALAEQVETLKKQISTQEKAIAKAEGTIITLKANSTEQTKLEKELGKQQSLVAKLYTQIQTIEAEQAAEAEVEEAEAEAEAAIERTVEEDRALVLARISSYQVNLRFSGQPKSSIIDDQIGWFD